jgi:HSP20 family protein
MMTLYRPNAIQHALSDFDRYLESFFGDSSLAPATRIFNRVPAVDIRETEKAYMLEMELPGYDEKNIDIHVDGSILFIASKQEKVVPPAESASPADSVPFVKAQDPADPASPMGPKEEQEGASPAKGWILRERRVSSFSRSFKLPENANPEEVSAEFKNGILTMTIQKREEAQKRTIQIKVK